MRINFAFSLERKNLVIVFLVFWLVILTAGIIVGGLMVIGKFSRMKRDQGELAEGVFNELDMMGDSLERLMKDFKNLEAGFENLQKTLENPSEVSEQFEWLKTRMDNLALSEATARQDINLLLSANKEHPVLAPATPNKGGRPRKELLGQ